jgi:hypothetical protein
MNSFTQFNLQKVVNSVSLSKNNKPFTLFNIQKLKKEVISVTNLMLNVVVITVRRFS